MKPFGDAYRQGHFQEIDEEAFFASSQTVLQNPAQLESYPKRPVI
jgi:hypothetical protein